MGVLAEPLDVLACLAVKGKNLAQERSHGGLRSVNPPGRAAGRRRSSVLACVDARCRNWSLKELAAESPDARPRMTQASSDDPPRRTTSPASKRLGTGVASWLIRRESASILSPTMVYCIRAAAWNQCMQKPPQRKNFLPMPNGAEGEIVAVERLLQHLGLNPYSVARAWPPSKPRP